MGRRSLTPPEPSRRRPPRSRERSGRRPACHHSNARSTLRPAGARHPAPTDTSPLRRRATSGASPSGWEPAPAAGLGGKERRSSQQCSDYVDTPVAWRAGCTWIPLTGSPSATRLRDRSFPPSICGQGLRLLDANGAELRPEDISLNCDTTVTIGMASTRRRPPGRASIARPVDPRVPPHDVTRPPTPAPFVDVHRFLSS